ncbi:MAG: putative bifunctional diguanylate cyclase/phosphodiesterase [Lachnospiraceae bacterium]
MEQLHENKLLKVIQSISGTLVSLFDVDSGWQLLGNDCQVFCDDALESSCDILNLLQQYVTETDLDTYLIFYNKICKGIRGNKEYIPIEEAHIDVAVHLKNGIIPCYHKIECFFDKDENGAITAMLVMVAPLEAEEIYRLTLAQNITNDRSPSMFIRVANEVIRKDTEKQYALIQFDVAKFKAINEMYGEAFGDEVLNYFLEALKVICNPNQCYVRLTADVFMILTSYETDQDLLDFVELVNKSLLNYKNTTYRLVFGICKISDLETPLRKYGDRAALARQSIKSSALEYVKFFEEDMKTTVLNSKYIEDHMEKALNNHEFVMYLQPKYSINKNVIVGAEALVRWFQKDNGLIQPNQFIPIFEKNGFIKKMDAYIWETACKTIRKWIDRGVMPLPISVNVSRVHLSSGDFIDTLNELAHKYRIPKQLLEIEITETVDNTNRMMEYVTQLKKDGFKLLMDDFGSGYSSLNTLKDTQFDVLKIDRGFLQDFIDSDRGQKIVAHTIDMSKAIGMDLVAEGVETKEQADFLSSCGCDVAQGFYYAKPMPVEEFEKLLGM